MSLKKSPAYAGLLLILFVGGCGDGCGGQATPQEREPLSLIPEDAWIVASLEMSPVRDSAAYKRMLQNGNPTAYYLGEECAYDPLPDINRIWVGSGAGVENGRGAIVAFGDVNQEKVLDCFRGEMRRRGLSLEEVDMEGFTVYTPGPGRPHVAWIDSKTVVVADRDNMIKVLGLAKGKGQSIRTNQTLLKLWERASRDRDVALAILPHQDASKRVGALLPDAYGAVDTTEQLALGLRFMKGMDFYVSVRLEDATDVELLSQRLTKDLGRWADLDLVKIAGMSEHLKAIHLEHAGPEITATGHWSERQLDSVARLAVDSIDEVMRSGQDPEKALRERLRGKQVDGGAGSDGSPPSVDGGASKAASDGG